MTRVLLFGAAGQLGRALMQAPWPEGWTIEGLSRVQGADLSKPETLIPLIEAAGPDVVVNAAAYTAVDKAEEEEALAHRINAEAPAVMAEAAKARGASFIHISTDYVFDGSGVRPWEPEDATAPLNAYGRTKRAGEEAVAKIGGRWTILRTSWVYDGVAKNFLTTMLRLADGREELRVVADQIGAPTFAPDLARAVVRVGEAMTQDEAAGGLHHCCGAGETSWAGFARAIFEERRVRAAADWPPAPRVTDIATEDWPTPAPRPKNSRLSTASFEAAFAFAMRPWRDALVDAMDAGLRLPRTKDHS